MLCADIGMSDDEILKDVIKHTRDWIDIYMPIAPNENTRLIYISYRFSSCYVQV